MRFLATNGNSNSPTPIRVVAQNTSYGDAGLGVSSTRSCIALYFFFFKDTATTEIYTLSLHDALPISVAPTRSAPASWRRSSAPIWRPAGARSEEHTSELQSHVNLVCRLLLEKKK